MHAVRNVYAFKRNQNRLYTRIARSTVVPTHNRATRSTLRLLGDATPTAQHMDWCRALGQEEDGAYLWPDMDLPLSCSAGDMDEYHKRVCY